jgi:hypothetical protein
MQRVFFAVNRVGLAEDLTGDALVVTVGDVKVAVVANAYMPGRGRTPVLPDGGHRRRGPLH